MLMIQKYSQIAYKFFAAEITLLIAMVSLLKVYIMYIAALDKPVSTRLKYTIN